MIKILNNNIILILKYKITSLLSIALTLPGSIKEKKLITRDVSSLDRIIGKYFSQKRRNIKEEKEIIEFLFQYLDINGKDSSILFRHLDQSQERETVIKRLYENYKDKFDFNIINSSLFDNSYQKIKKFEHVKYLLLLIPLLLMIILFLYIKNQQLKIAKNDQIKLLEYKNTI